MIRELECNRALLTMALISGADVSMPAFELQDDSFNIHRDIILAKTLLTVIYYRATGGFTMI